ncbi:MerR family transcriptional regulator [Bermanella sp. R86510]|uniref:MerR family transcriptional regulator n=1 Tax=unclassified Bermanella TaxID=2627862 RepID=UPI0037C5C8E0
MLTIGQFAKAGEVGVETIRFYQRKGLLRVPKAGQGIRKYDEEDMHCLRFIRNAQSAGFTLNEIKELISLDSSHDRRRVRELAELRVEALDAQIEQLEKARGALQRLAKECAHSDAGPCPILESFDP